MRRTERTTQHDELTFLDRYNANAFDRPSVTVDVVLLTGRAGALHALFIRRREHPFKDAWSLPGGFVGMGESLDEAATRVLRDKAHVEGVYLEQLYTFGEVGRDPRMRVISVAHVALVEAARLEHVEVGGEVQLAELAVDWEGETGGPAHALGQDGALLPLAFDHAQMLGLAIKRLRGKLNYAPIGFQLLAPRFTLRELQNVHETILSRRLNKDSFRRRMLATGQLLPVGEREEEATHRPAELYTFAEQSAV